MRRRQEGEEGDATTIEIDDVGYCGYGNSGGVAVLATSPVDVMTPIVTWGGGRVQEGFKVGKGAFLGDLKGIQIGYEFF